jgi:hypothetical protein
MELSVKLNNLSSVKSSPPFLLYWFFKIEKDIAQKANFVHIESSLLCSKIMISTLLIAERYSFAVRYDAFHAVI